jgi:hypothetical protein
MHTARVRGDSDDRARPQTGDLVAAVPDLTENLVGALTEQMPGMADIRNGVSMIATSRVTIRLGAVIS